MTDPFNRVKDEHFMALLKRRAHMLVNPGEMIPVADDIVIDVLYKDDGCCGHDEIRVWVGNLSSGKGVMMNHGDMSVFLRQFFGLEEVE